MDKPDSNEDFDKLTSILLQDVIRCQEAVESAEAEEDRQFWSRTYIRAVFAAIEGWCKSLGAQVMAAETHKVANGHIEVGKISILAGESYYIDGAGQIRWQPIRISTLNNILFILNSYAEAHGVAHRAKRSSKDWDKMVVAIKFRDGLMHPKTCAGLQITPQQFLDTKNAFKWFLEQLAAVMREKGCSLPPCP